MIFCNFPRGVPRAQKVKNFNFDMLPVCQFFIGYLTQFGFGTTKSGMSCDSQGEMPPPPYDAPDLDYSNYIEFAHMWIRSILVISLWIIVFWMQDSHSKYAIEVNID